MDSGYIYAIVALVCFFELMLIYNRTITTNYPETIDSAFIKVLKFFALFCLVDALWGLCDAPGLFDTPKLMNAVTHAYHTLCALSAFIWFGYIMDYMKVSKTTRRILNLIRGSLIVCQLSMVVYNIFTGAAVYFDENLVYVRGEMRTWMYLAQFLYYILILGYSFAMLQINRAGNRTVYREVIMFSAIPLLFGIGQMLFYDVAMYSMGFMLSAFVVYAYKLTTLREELLSGRAAEAKVLADVDSLTGLLNRRAYEEELKAQWCNTEPDLLYVSVDLNGLKQANDTRGHDAGDALLKGAADCLLSTFSPFGHVYRLGGDEFAAILKVDNEQRAKLPDKLKKAVNDYRAPLVKDLSLSVGFAGRMDFPGSTVLELASQAEQLMYKDKAAYYASKGVDRRGQHEAHVALCGLYTKILKINLTTDTYQILSMDENEKQKRMGFSNRLSTWLREFGTSGQVHPDDLKMYLEHTSLPFLRSYFEQGNKSLQIIYRRYYRSEYKNCVMQIIPASNYTLDNQTLFLYVNIIDAQN